jgi:hypothetical protein
MLWYLPELLIRAITWLLSYTSQTLLILSFLLSAAYSLGWIHRFIWYRAEQEISKILNDTPVTIGSLRLDLLRGKVWASNVVLHSPKRKEWKWESPLLGRVGKVYIESNLVQCILFDIFLREKIPLEVRTVHASDIQGFVERKQNVFNFYLLDKQMILPEPQDLPDEDDDIHTPTTPHVESNVSASASAHGVAATATSADTSMNINSSSWDPEEPLDGADANYETSEKAQRLVDDMVRAVQSLGRAAQEGSLQGALHEHRHNFTTKLRALQTSSKKSQAMKEGVKIAQEVGKAVAEKSQNVQHFVVPPRRKDEEDEEPPLCRIGRIVIRDARIFTRDHWDDTVPTSPDGESKPVNRGKASWNKPITLKQIVIRSVELCPPVSVKDEEGLPALYQPIDALIDVVWKRILAEVAKTNSGHLFQTAMGEVLDYYRREKEGGGVLPTGASY